MQLPGFHKENVCRSLVAALHLPLIVRCASLEPALLIVRGFVTVRWGVCYVPLTDTLTRRGNIG